MTDLWEADIEKSAEEIKARSPVGSPVMTTTLKTIDEILAEHDGYTLEEYAGTPSIDAINTRQQITQLVSEALEYQVDTIVVPEAKSLYGEPVNDLTYISLEDVKRNLLERGITT